MLLWRELARIERKNIRIKGVAHASILRHVPTVGRNFCRLVID